MSMIKSLSEVCKNNDIDQVRHLLQNLIKDELSQIGPSDSSIKNQFDYLDNEEKPIESLTRIIIISSDG